MAKRSIKVVCELHGDVLKFVKDEQKKEKKKRGIIVGKKVMIHSLLRELMTLRQPAA